MRLNQKLALRNGYKLMLVDDDEGIVDSLSAFLRRSGYDVYGVSSPLEGLEELKRNKYDLLILDYFMPFIKGDEFVARLRKFDRDLYVILLTGHTDLAPPLETIKALDIQAYCEKSSRLDQLLLLIESGVKSINQMKEIMKFRDGLNNILVSLPEVFQLKPIDYLLDIILIRMQTISKSGNSFILVDSPSKNGFSAEKSMFKGSGWFGGAEDPLKKLSPEMLETVGRARRNCEAVVTDGGVVLPLPGANAVQGVAYVSGRLEQDSKKLLELFISQAAVSLHNAMLHSMLDKKTDELTTAYSTLKSSYLETIEALRLAVDTKDVYTRGHSDRVSRYAELIGRKLGMDADDLEVLRISGLFHDIGKIGLSDRILLKDSELNDDELAEMKKHPEKGVMILSAVSAFTKVTDNVGSHHERIDGLGYPDGLAGGDIPFGARILSAADAFDAMRSDRQYRKRIPKDVAIEQLAQGKGTQFDKEIVDCFIGIDKEAPESINNISDNKD